MQKKKKTRTKTVYGKQSHNMKLCTSVTTTNERNEF